MNSFFSFFFFPRKKKARYQDQDHEELEEYQLNHGGSLAVHAPTPDLTPATSYFEEGYKQANGMDTERHGGETEDAFDNPSYANQYGIQDTQKEPPGSFPGYLEGSRDADPDTIFNSVLRHKPMNSMGGPRALVAQSRMSMGPLLLDADTPSTEHTYDKVYSTNTFA